MKVTTFQGNDIVIDDPNICPHCHVTNIPQHRWNCESWDTDNIPVFLSVWQCANVKCKKLFVAIHKGKNNIFLFDRFLNGLPKGPNWPKPIRELRSGQSTEEAEEDKIASKFIRTYLQSLEAETSGLDELAGMGYRKAIEYLVKDWAIQNNEASEKDKIEDLWLGSVIENYYDGELKDILKRATWLGNDQAHYKKLFEEYDIDVLKDLIDLIMVELDRAYKKAHYINTIKNKKNV